MDRLLIVGSGADVACEQQAPAMARVASFLEEQR